MMIRPVQLSDAAAIRAIYQPYVTETAITFEVDVPTVQEFESRITKTLTQFPYLVAEVDGKVVGYAYASTYYARAAYDWTTELSIYVAKSAWTRDRIGPLYCLRRSCKHEATYAFWLASQFRTKQAFPCMKSEGMSKWLISQRLAISLTNGMISSGCKRRSKGQ